MQRGHHWLVDDPDGWEGGADKAGRSLPKETSQHLQRLLLTHTKLIAPGHHWPERELDFQTLSFGLQRIPLGPLTGKLLRILDVAPGATIAESLQRCETKIV